MNLVGIKNYLCFPDVLTCNKRFKLCLFIYPQFLSFIRTILLPLESIYYLYLSISIYLFIYIYSLEQKVVEKFTKLSKIGFSMECFAADFSQFSRTSVSKFAFWVAGWVLTIKYKHFRDFLKIS